MLRYLVPVPERQEKLQHRTMRDWKLLSLQCILLSQVLTLGKSQYPYNRFIGDKSIEIEPTLKILGVTLDRDLSLKPHVAIMLKKAYAQIAALWRIKRLVPLDVMIFLYKAFVLPHLEYCCPLLLGIPKVLKNNIERTNHYAINTLLNLGNSATYDFRLAMADMDKLEQKSQLAELPKFRIVLIA